MIKQPREIPIIVEQQYNVPVPELWDAITQLEQMKGWFFDNIPDFKPEVGFETQFLVNAGERNFTHLWRIIKVVPHKKITYDWRYAECKGEGLVTFELFDDGAKSSLRLTAIGLETFPDDLPEFTRESGEAGWEYFLKQNLKNYLDTQVH
tara:strand:+ start:61 stop:510 length:450 start_codon:yes stop_codon:yes gene_type:complete